MKPQDVAKELNVTFKREAGAHNEWWYFALFKCLDDLDSFIDLCAEVSDTHITSISYSSGEHSANWWDYEVQP